MRRESRLRFTDEELEPERTEPKSSPPGRGAGRRKPARADAKSLLRERESGGVDQPEPKEHRNVKRRTVGQGEKSKKKRLYFEDTDRITESKLRHTASAPDAPVQTGKRLRATTAQTTPEALKSGETAEIRRLTDAPLNAARAGVNPEPESAEDEDTGQESAEALEETAETGGRIIRETVTERKLRAALRASGKRAAQTVEGSTESAPPDPDAPRGESPAGLAFETAASASPERRADSDHSRTADSQRHGESGTGKMVKPASPEDSSESRKGDGPARNSQTGDSPKAEPPAVPKAGAKSQTEAEKARSSPNTKKSDGSKTKKTEPDKPLLPSGKSTGEKGGKPGREKASDADKIPGAAGSLLWDATVAALLSAAHREIEKDEQDNVGVESVHRLEEAAETGGRFAEHSARSRKLREHRTAVSAEHRLDSASGEAMRNDPQFSTNPLSRWQQKRAIRKQYAAMRRAEQAAESASAAAKTTRSVERAVEQAGRAARAFVVRRRRVLCVCAALFFLVAMMSGVMSSCSALVQGGLSVLSGSTFPSRDADMLGAEAAYAAMEADLREYLDTYESTHSYDEYHFDLDVISHNPYVLISILTAYHRGEWTLDEVRDTLDMLFDRQYILTENVVRETRHDSDGEPYSYYICYVTLENFDLSHLPVYIMDEDQVSVYATYMACQGNRPDLFPADEYPGVPRRGEYPRYEVPPDALSDARFAAMLHEAEKYLGYPYVWGGSSPATSFDCSGFVSWVINHSGWSVGRLGAQALCNLCTPVSPENARPGDLVFFRYTYAAPIPDGVTHCGIYVGGNMMLHCGNPISYTNLNSSYWQEHFYCYGRLPPP